MIGLVAATLSCALSASAFLLPPSTKNAVASWAQDASTNSRVVMIPCSSCAFPYKDYKVDNTDNTFWAQGAANLLAFNFTVPQDRPTELQLNDHTIFPFNFWTEVENLASEWTIDQIPASSTEPELVADKHARAPLKITGNSIGVGPSQTFEDGAELLSIRVQILGLNEHDMDINPLLVQLVREANGELVILTIDSAPSHVLDELAFPMPGLPPMPEFGMSDLPLPQVGRPAPEHKPECGFLPQAMCDFGHRIASKFHGPRPGCHKGGKGKQLPSHITTHLGPFDGKPEDVERPHHGFGHGHHDHHHRHGVFHAVSKGILAILIPVMAGITVGMTVSVLGLMFGRFIGWLWFTVIPGRRRGYVAVITEEDIVSADPEKNATYVDEVETLPLYEDAPAYEEVAKEDK